MNPDRRKKQFKGVGLFVPKTMRKDHFLWHNHIMHTNNMTPGTNGFRCYFAEKPVDYRSFMRCKCGWSELPHYSRRFAGPQKSWSLKEMVKRKAFSAGETHCWVTGQPYVRGESK
jgi:hypothetical protein